MRARGRPVARAAAAASLCVLAACGSAATTSGGSPTLTWYVGPDQVDAATLAKSCADASEGDYRIAVKRLPNDVTRRHAALVRRLAAKDTSIDLLSLDSSFTAEFAEAQFLAPLPEDVAAAYATDIAPTALAAATYDGLLVAAPWWFDPQLLWYRGNVAERAGLDTTKPVTWDDLITGADRLGVTVQIEDRDGTGLSEWVNALVAGAGGNLVDGTGRDATVGLDSAAGRAAAEIVAFHQESNVGPGPSAGAVKAFAGADGGFLLARSSVIADPALATVAAEMRWTSYPAVEATSVAPLSGVNLAVPLYAKRSDLSYRAITCLTSAPSMAAIMTSVGHSASRLTTYDDPSVKAAYPMAKVTRAAVKSGRAVPGTPYWHLVKAGLDEAWSPVRDVASDETPKASQKRVAARLAGELP